MRGHPSSVLRPSDTSSARPRGAQFCNGQSRFVQCPNLQSPGPLLLTSLPIFTVPLHSHFRPLPSLRWCLKRARVRMLSFCLTDPHSPLSLAPLHGLARSKHICLRSCQMAPSATPTVGSKRLERCDDTNATYHEAVCAKSRVALSRVSPAPPTKSQTRID